MEQNSSQSNASETHKQNLDSEKQLIEYHEVEGTPFTVSKWKDEWYILLGYYRLTTGFKTREDAEADIKEITWFKVLGVMQAVIMENDRHKAQVQDTVDTQQLKLNLERQKREQDWKEEAQKHTKQ